MNDEQKMVIEFHQKFGFTINDTPTLVPYDLGQQRHYFTLREMDELLSAVVNNNLVGVADALADILYFVYGTAIVYGIDMEPIFREIHCSNMTKTPPPKSVGKAIKGESYSPPNIEPLLEAMKK